jgi:pyruvate kinase
VIVSQQTSESKIFSKAGIFHVADNVRRRVDAIMLSNEFSTLPYQIKAIEILDKIIEETESEASYIKRLENESILPHQTVVDAICSAAKSAAEFSCANAIVLFTDFFDDALRCARIDPLVPIILVANSFEMAARSGLCNGLYAVVNKREIEMEQICKTAKSIVLEHKIAAVGDNIVVLNNCSENSLSICRL